MSLEETKWVIGTGAYANQTENEYKAKYSKLK